jgi:ubiquinone/menaquinone biosynthesis C-methylase UbiE
MTYKEIFFPEVKFGGFTDIDGTIAFFLRVNSLINSAFTVLDVGCGRGEYIEDTVSIRRNIRILKGKVAKVIGIDVDDAAQSNEALDEFHMIEGNNWPIKNDSIDLIVCDHVLEHVMNPDKFFSEADRVLKNRGYICIRTPNYWSYVALFARFIPNKYHSKVTAIVQESRKKEDVFPTVYRCNSIKKIKKMMNQHNIESVVYGYEPEPSYLSFSSVAYWLGILHQRFSPRFLKPLLFAFGRIKKDVANATF